MILQDGSPACNQTLTALIFLLYFEYKIFQIIDNFKTLTLKVLFQFLSELVNRNDNLAFNLFDFFMGLQILRLASPKYILSFI